MRALSIIVLLAIGCGSNAAPSGNVGDACMVDSDCKQSGASCIKESEHAQWKGGYCVVKNCSTDSCPNGSFCHMGGTALGAITCLKTCASMGDCREGYRCCPSTQPTGGMVCAPPGAGTLCP